MFKYLSKVLYVLTGKRKQLLLLLGMFIFVSILEAFGIGLIGPFLAIASDPNIIRDQAILGPLFSRLNITTDTAIIVASAAVVITVFCFKSVAYFFCRFYIYRFSYKQKKALESRLINTYLHISYLFHLENNSAVITKNLTFESGQFTVNCLIPLLEIVSNIIVLMLLIGLLALTDLSLVVMVLAILLPIFLLFAKLSRRIRRWGRIKSEAQADMIRSINHGLGGLKETRVLGCEDYFEADLRGHSNAYGEAAVLVDALQMVPRISIETVLVVFLNAFLLLSQQVLGRSLDELTAIMGVFAVSSIRMLPASSQILNAVGRLRSMSYAVDMLYRDLKAIERYATLTPVDQLAATDQLASRQNQTTTQFDKEIELDDLTFYYPNAAQPSIDKVSLTLRKGESIALVGKSGSGKTTLVDIILGLLHPASGDIRVDGKSVYQDLRGWQNLLGYIPQSIFLTDETVAQNIAFGIPPEEIDPVRLRSVVKAAQLEELIEQLPQGLDTPVGERGVRLSGGQRQRIGIARALYYEREILVLDEATSALDTETEKLVSDAINALAGSKTLIIIAHRYSTIENCDRVYRLEEGRVANVGSYEEVIMAQSARR